MHLSIYFCRETQNQNKHKRASKLILGLFLSAKSATTPKPMQKMISISSPYEQRNKVTTRLSILLAIFNLNNAFHKAQIEALRTVQNDESLCPNTRFPIEFIGDWSSAYCSPIVSMSWSIVILQSQTQMEMEIITKTVFIFQIQHKASSFV